MLGEGLNTGAAAQFMKYDEAAVDRPRHRGRRAVLGLLLGLGAVLALLFA